ncbi:cyclin-Y-like protein 1 [Eptesicus fuscus]|uniref:cyclin-Y-like protein 1 n=1 Tax=Eptesicus fuscus TaxID=29078 RepID=UPI0024041A33|nr:cyclin-Y-like protein 1 [Eptesicus fuscus]
MGNKLTCRCLKPNASPKVGRSLEWVNPYPESYVCEVTRAAREHKDVGLVFCKCHPVLRLSDLQMPKVGGKRKNNYFYHVSPGHLREKYSSCATVYVDYSISQPDLRIAVQCLALAIYYHIKNRDSNRSKDIFDERLHPVTEEKVPEEFFHHNPDPESIYRFIRPFFFAYKVTAGYAITTLVYIERLLIYAEIDLCPFNWKRIVLEAIIQAYKYLHDLAIWNTHFTRLLRGITIKDLNELERQYICLLRFHLYVSASVYAQYYFDLRSLASDHGLPIALAPLQKERALNLEAISKYCENKNLCKVAIKKSGSCDNLTNVQYANAILS